MSSSNTDLQTTPPNWPATQEAGELSLPERAGYVAAGLVLAAAAARPRPNPVLTALALGAGAYLAWRGAQGTCPMKAALVRQGVLSA
ncbi:hypothetical protein [Teichococcus vastitatis]|uniref:DUF2892 domain-containing protein n=1 Tax=Teichococcus vastitatis TaxID=2307076 RepID=A0ABS9WC12_9PROT|nr:hypothetical protein [Pseudoroseomonas vastitatis]MCI0756837.1 hypothetical protein [Pseudoroseomonas vastitatis]